MNAPLPLQIMDHCINGRSIEWIAPDQKRVERETLAQKIILNELRYITINTFIGLHLDEVWRHFDHINKMRKWFIGQFDKPLLEDFLGGGHETQIACAICGVAFL